jgi:hypothetical protein
LIIVDPSVGGAVMTTAWFLVPFGARFHCRRSPGIREAESLDARHRSGRCAPIGRG